MRVPHLIVDQLVDNDGEHQERDDNRHDASPPIPSAVSTDRQYLFADYYTISRSGMPGASFLPPTWRKSPWHRGRSALIESGTISNVRKESEGI